MTVPTVFVAAGHGVQPDNDPGAKADGLVERDELAKFVGGMRNAAVEQNIPRNLGGVVFVPDELSLGGQITYLRNGWKATTGDLGVDFHLDYHVGVSGALAIVDQSSLGIEFGTYFLQRWCEETGIRNRGVFDSKKAARDWRGWDNYGWCRYAYSGVIIELGTLNSAADMAKVTDPEYHALAMALVWEGWNHANGMTYARRATTFTNIARATNVSLLKPSSESRGVLREAADSPHTTLDLVDAMGGVLALATQALRETHAMEGRTSIDADSALAQTQDILASLSDREYVGKQDENGETAEAVTAEAVSNGRM